MHIDLSQHAADQDERVHSIGHSLLVGAAELADLGRANICTVGKNVSKVWGSVSLPPPDSPLTPDPDKDCRQMTSVGRVREQNYKL